MNVVLKAALAATLAAVLATGAAQVAGATTSPGSSVTAPAGQRTTVQATVSAPVASFITALYNDFLSRNPSSDDIAWWGHNLATGSPRGAVAAGFVDSDEYRLIRIDAAYRDILTREAEPGGRASWLNGMKIGLLTTDDIERSLYASDEFYNDNGGNEFGWINGLYEHILGRGASMDEVGYWLNQGNAYALAQSDWIHQPPGVDIPLVFPRLWIVNNIMNSTEGARSRVSAMYQHYLGRVPDAGGLALWANYDLAVGDSATRSGLTGSDEYFALASQRF
ncbi:DUF4214 domain-containing protein [Subtercola sp. YIM 133946]|uniref:DUF4214 domain-containing protein n=1 Tax=Subtercola sp. YIM 133946 TaxID=3118909 RepID=UPI002F94FDCF